MAHISYYIQGPYISATQSIDYSWLLFSCTQCWLILSHGVSFLNLYPLAKSITAKCYNPTDQLLPLDQLALNPPPPSPLQDNLEASAQEFRLYVTPP